MSNEIVLSRGEGTGHRSGKLDESLVHVVTSRVSQPGNEVSGEAPSDLEQWYREAKRIYDGIEQMSDAEAFEAYMNLPLFPRVSLYGEGKLGTFHKDDVFPSWIYLAIDAVREFRHMYGTGGSAIAFIDKWTTAPAFIGAKEDLLRDSFWMMLFAAPKVVGNTISVETVGAVYSRRFGGFLNKLRFRVLAVTGVLLFAMTALSLTAVPLLSEESPSGQETATGEISTEELAAMQEMMFGSRPAEREVEQTSLQAAVSAIAGCSLLGIFLWVVVTAVTVARELWHDWQAPEQGTGYNLRGGTAAATPISRCTHVVMKGDGHPRMADSDTPEFASFCGTFDRIARDSLQKALHEHFRGTRIG